MILTRVAVALDADVRDFTEKIDDTVNRISAIGSRLQSIGTVMTAAVTVPLAAVSAAVVGAVTQVSTFADRLNDLAAATGLTTAQIQQFEFAAKVTGSSAEVLTSAAGALFTRLREGGNDAKRASEVLGELGVSSRDATGHLRPMSELFPEIITKLQGVDDVTQRVSLATGIFGRSAQELAPILGMGADEFQKLTARASELGLVIGQDALDRADAFGERWNTIKERLAAVGRAVAVDLLPVAEKLIGVLEKTFIPILETVARWVGKLSDTQLVWITTTAAVVAAIGPLLVAVGSVLTILPQLSAAVAFLGGASVLGLIPLAIASVVAAGVQLVKHWDDLKETTSAWAIALGSIVTGMWEKIKLTFKNALDAIWGPFKAGLDKIKGAWEWLSDVVVGHSIVPDMWEKIKQSFAGGTSKVIEISVRTVDRVVQAMNSMSTDSLSALDDIFNGGLSKLIDNATSKLSGFFSFLGGAGQTIASGGIGAALTSLFGGLTDAIFNGSSRFRQAVESWQSAMDAFFDRLDSWTDRILGREHSISDEGDDFANDAFQGLKNTPIANGMQQWWNQVMDMLSGDLSDLDKADQVIEFARKHGLGSLIPILQQYFNALQQIKSTIDNAKNPGGAHIPGSGGGMAAGGGASLMFGGGTKGGMVAPTNGSTVTINFNAPINAGAGSTPDQIASAIRKALDSISWDDTKRSLLMSGDAAVA